MKSYTLGDVIHIKHGYPFEGQYFTETDNGIVLVTPGNFQIGGGFQDSECKFYTGKIPNAFVLKPGDLIVTMTDLSKTIDTLGYSAIVPDHHRTYLHNQRIGLITLKNDVCDKGYLYWLMRTRHYHLAIAGSSSGATVHHTSPEKIYAYAFHAPDIEQQRKIAQTLFSYDRLIENHRRQIALLEEATQRMYKEWFVDLRFPGAGSVMIVNGLPDGWKRLPFFPTIEIMSGGTPSTSKPDYYRGNIPFFTPKDCGDHFFAFDTEKHISEDGLKHCNSQLYPKNTIVITARGTVGKVILLGVPMAMNQSCFAFRSDEIASPYFLYFLLRHASDELRIKANGGVFDTITIRSFNDMSVLVPDPKRMNQFLKIITPMMEQMQVFSKETTYLQEARDRLLPRLMAGGDGASSLPR